MAVKDALIIAVLEKDYSPELFTDINNFISSACV